MDNANVDYNVCTNWSLWCYDTKQTSKGLVLKCSMSSKRKNSPSEKPEYTAPVFIDVFCGFEDCQIEPKEYASSRVHVDGKFTASDFTTTDGRVLTTMTIYATKVA